MVAAAAEEIRRGPRRRPRRRLLRHAQQLLQHGPAQAPPARPRVPRGHARRGGPDDRRIRARRPHPPRPPEAQDLLLRAPAAGLPGLQRADQAALRPGRRDHGEQRARPLRHLPQGRGRSQGQGRRRRHGQGTGSRQQLPRHPQPAGPVRGGPAQVHGGQPGRLAVRRLRQQVLAGLRELFRLRPLLRQLAPGRARHPGRLRGRHLRRPERVHLRLRHRAADDHPRHQQHRPLRHDRRGQEGPQGLQADGPVHGLPLRQHAGALHARPGHALPAHHAPPAGARERTERHPRHAGGADPDGRRHHLPPAIDGRHGPPVLYRRGRGARRRSEVLRGHRRHRHQGDGPVLPARPHREALPPPHGRGLRPRGQDALGGPARCSASRTSASTGRRECGIRRRTRSSSRGAGAPGRLRQRTSAAASRRAWPRCRRTRP